jgi:O-antigen ligase
MTNVPRSDNSQSPRKRRCGLPIADAWLPDLGAGEETEGERPTSGLLKGRKSWQEMTARERNLWLVKAVLLGGLMLTVVFHPSSGVRDIAVWGAFLYVLFSQRKALFTRKPDVLSLALLAYVVIVLASVVYSAHRNWSIKDALKFAVVLAMVFGAWHLVKNRAFLLGFLQLLIASVLVVCICDLVTYLLGLGRLWDWGERWVDGPYYGHPNTASAIIILLMPIAVFLLLFSPNKWLKAIHGSFLVVGLFLVYVMASRTAQIALAVIVLCGAVLIRPWKRRVIALLAVGCVLAAAFLNLRALNPRFMDETFRSMTFRDENWRNLRTLIAKRPVFGYGYGKTNYQTVYHRSFPGSVIPYQHAHSLILQTAFETGIVGLAAMMWLWGTVAYRLLRGYALNRNPYGTLCAAVFTSLIGISVYCLAEVPDGFLRSLSWLLVAITGALTGGPNRK